MFLIIDSVCHHPTKYSSNISHTYFHTYLISSIVYLYLVTINIDLLVSIIEHCGYGMCVGGWVGRWVGGCWNWPILELRTKHIIRNSKLWTVKERASNGKNSFCSMGYSLWYVKIDPSQNQDLSISLERPWKKLLNAIFGFEIRYFKLKLWVVKERV